MDKENNHVITDSYEKIKIVEEKTYQLYTEHIYTITHELRSPLAVINGSTYTSNESLRALFKIVENDPKAVELIKTIKNNLENINHQVIEIEKFMSDVSEHGFYSKDSKLPTLLPIKPYLEHIVKIAPNISRSMAIFDEGSIGFKCDNGIDFENIHIFIPPQELNRIMLNILTNAADAAAVKWKTTHGNYHPEISISCLKSINENQGLIFKPHIHGPFGKSTTCSFFIVIEDNATGISEDNLKKLFKEQFTTKRSEQYHKHIGYGLKVCLKIAEKYGLNIMIDTKKDEYTRFIIGVPEYIIASPEQLEKIEKIKYNEVLSFPKDYSMLKFSKCSKILFDELIESTVKINSNKNNQDDDSTVLIIKKLQ